MSARLFTSTARILSTYPPRIQHSNFKPLSTRTMSTSTSAKTPFIVAFYDPTIKAQDAEGRTLDETLDFSNDQLEYYHDYIQYLFPLPERSPVNPSAPTITKDVREAFLTRQHLRKQLGRSLERMANFYGFEASTTTTSISASDKDSDGTTNPTLIFKSSSNFDTLSKQSWRKRFDHNHLRITRIIRSLRVLGLEVEAQAFRKALVENDEPQKVSERSRMFWARAAERGLHLSPQEEDEGARGIEWLREEGS